MDTAPTTTTESRRIQQSDVPPGTIKSRHLEEGIQLSSPIITTPTITVGSDATGDLYYRDANGVFTRLPIGSSTNVLTVSGGLPAWTAASTPSYTWSSYTPSYSASGSMTFTKDTTRKEIYATVGKIVFVSLCIGGTTGGTASTDIYVTSPVAFATSTQDFYGGGCLVFDGNYLAGNWGNLDANTIKVRRYDGGNWGIGASKFIVLDLFYEIS